MSEFIIITRKQFEDFLPQNFSIIDLPGSKEIVYDIPTKNQKLNLRIYSSVDVRSQDTRDIGTDAIRCVLVDIVSGKPLDKGKRTHRMTRWRNKLQEKIDELQNKVDSVKFCKTCGSAMREIDKGKGIFWGCIKYPICKTTLSEDGKWRESVGESGSETSQKIVLCPLCNSLMKKRSGSRGEFYGCSKFPNCRGTRQVKDVDMYGQGVQAKQESNEEQVQDDFVYTPTVQKPQENKQIDVPEDDSHIELIESKKFPLLKFKFDKFNPVQSRVFKYYDQDINLIVAAATSAGKTIIAEMLMADSIAKGKKAIFLSPLKAVSQEKNDDWKNSNHDWSKLNVSIVTGDYALTEKRVEELNKANVIVMTSEMLDSRTRRIKTEKNNWLLDAGTLVCDESHLLTTNRGHALESAIMRFTKQNSSCRIVFLSATMPNVSELQKWLTFLNGKKTELINSNYRPCKLTVHYDTYNDAGRYRDNEQAKISKTIDLILEKYNKNEQTLVFVHAKKTGHIIKAMLEEQHGVRSEFHFADLSLEKRKQLEKEVREKTLKILIATSTLAWGVNI